jgi:uncharacterized protein (DUF1499 family)
MRVRVNKLMITFKVAAMAIVGLVVALVLAGQMGLWSGTTPTTLGVKQGKLLPPALSPNSVSSQADLYPDHPQRQTAYIAPISYQGSQAVAMDKLLQTLRSTPGLRVIESKPDYVYAQATTALMKFTDDLEFWFDPTQTLIHLRSASRVGESDLGKNRARMEDIRERFKH